MFTNQYLIKEWNEKYKVKVRLYDMDMVLYYVTLVPHVNRELGTNFVVEEKYKQQAEIIKGYEHVYGNNLHVPRRTTKLCKSKYEDDWEMVYFDGVCPACWAHVTKENLIDLVNALHGELSAHPDLFLESFKNIMGYDTLYCHNYNEIMQDAINHYKPLLEYDEMQKVIMDTCNLVMKRNRNFRGFRIQY